MRLEASTWISTTISGVYHELARIEGFKLLLAYIQGQNEYGKLCFRPIRYFFPVTVCESNEILSGRLS